MEDFDFPWPVAGEQLFRDDLPDWHYNACLQWDPNSFTPYAEGYKQAGRALVEEIGLRRGTVDFLVYPIVYLYRHYLELSMKSLIESGNRLLDIDEDFMDLHDLLALWKECRRILEQIEPPATKADLDAVEEKVKQLHRVDRDSMPFRYPKGKAKKNQARPNLLPPKFQRFNIRHFAEQMEQVAGFFSGAGEMIAVYLEQKHEMEAEYGDW